MDALETWRRGDDTDHLYEILDRVFRGLAIDAVTEQRAAVAACRPGKDAANELTSKEVTHLAHGHRGFFERYVIAVHEQDHFLAARDGQAPSYLGLQLL